ncbi:hypothetical protein L7F22_017322 [Adiantum nelumboides]|nr:hypothetical protein [Adiantum nelumboides]
MAEKIKQMEEERKQLEEQITGLKEEVNVLKGEWAASKDTKEEGEIHEADKEAIKEEITKEITKAMECKMEATKEGWVDVGRKKITKEVKEEKRHEETLWMHATLEEKTMREARMLNVRVSGIKEEHGSSPESDGRTLCANLGYTNTPFIKAWRVGKDPQKRVLMLQFKDLMDKITFLKKRIALRGLGGTPIYIDEDLTKTQVEHRKLCMPKIIQARKEGKKAFYRDGRIFIDGKPIA